LFVELGSDTLHQHSDQAMATTNLKTIHPSLQENETKTSSGTTVKSFSHDNGSDVILCMVHGYPQSSYE